MSEQTKGLPPEPPGGMSSAQRQERLAGLSPREKLARSKRRRSWAAGRSASRSNTRKES